MDGGWFATHTVEFTADASGNLTRRFWVGATEQPFEPEGRQWLSKMLPRFIRQTGDRRPGARRPDLQGTAAPPGVLAEISLIEGSWAKRVYFSELFKMPLDPATVRQALVQAGREIDSDFELASLLIDERGQAARRPGNAAGVLRCGANASSPISRCAVSIRRR